MTPSVFASLAENLRIQFVIRIHPLTFREKQVIELVRLAKANKEIALELHLAEATIKEYLNRIFRKLAVKNRTELAVWAVGQPELSAMPQCYQHLSGRPINTKSIS